MLGTADVSDAVEDDTEEASEPVADAEGEGEGESEEGVGSVDEASETELAVCEGASDDTAAELDGTDEGMASEELDGSAKLAEDALGPTDWSVVAEA